MTPESFSIELILPASYNQSGDGVANHVDDRAAHTEKTIDAKNQRHSGDGYGWDDHHGGNQRDEGRPLHSACAFRGEQGDTQDRELLRKG